MIETFELTRSYQSYVKPEGVWNTIRGFWDRQYITKLALAPTSIKIESGQIVGLVGANGAGKTTLLKLLSGLIHPSEGDAKVLGYTPWKREADFLRKISILLGQKNQLWWDLTPSDSYQLLAKIYDIGQSTVKRRVNELSEVLECSEQLSIQLRRLSLGERMKMEIIGSLIHEPEVLYLDEPTIGLDVVAQASIRQFLADYVKRKKPTVILTSHYMDDIAKLAHKLLLISQGSIVYEGTVNDFIKKTETKQTITIKYIEPLSNDLKLLNGTFLNKGESAFVVDVKEANLPKILNQLTSAAAVQELKINEADFEEVIKNFLSKESSILSNRNSNKHRV